MLIRARAMQAFPPPIRTTPAPTEKQRFLTQNYGLAFFGSFSVSYTSLEKTSKNLLLFSLLLCTVINTYISCKKYMLGQHFRAKVIGPTASARLRL